MRGRRTVKFVNNLKKKCELWKKWSKVRFVIWMTNKKNTRKRRKIRKSNMYRSHFIMQRSRWAERERERERAWVQYARWFLKKNRKKKALKHVNFHYSVAKKWESKINETEVRKKKLISFSKIRQDALKLRYWVPHMRVGMRLRILRGGPMNSRRSRIGKRRHRNSVVRLLSWKLTRRKIWMR